MISVLDITRLISPLTVTNLSLANMCFESSNLSITANLSLNFTLKEFTSGMEIVNNLFEEEIDGIDKLIGSSKNNELAGNEEEKTLNTDCECWSSERMKNFVKYMRNKLESPLVEEIERLSEQNKQLNYDLKRNITYIDNHYQVNSHSQETEEHKIMKTKYTDRLAEIQFLNKKIAKQSLLIEDYINKEEENFECMRKKFKGCFTFFII